MHIENKAIRFSKKMTPNPIKHLFYTKIKDNENT